MLKTEGNLQRTWGQLQGTLLAWYGRPGASDSGVTERDFRDPVHTALTESQAGRGEGSSLPGRECELTLEKGMTETAATLALSHDARVGHIPPVSVEAAGEGPETAAATHLAAVSLSKQNHWLAPALSIFR